MRGGRDADWIPMFPRLHNNATAREGPKAPLRNKMALYERLSAPNSQHFGNGMASVLPVQPIKGSTSNGKGQEESGVSLIFNPSLTRQSSRLASTLSGRTSEKALTPNSALKPIGCGTVDAFPTLSPSSTFCLSQSRNYVPSTNHLVSKAKKKKGFSAVGLQRVKLDSRSKQQSQDSVEVVNPHLMHSLMRLQNGNGRGLKGPCFMRLQSRDSFQISDVCKRTMSVSSSTDDNTITRSSKSNEFCLSSKEETWNYSQKSNLVDESIISLDISVKTHGSVQENIVSTGGVTGQQDILGSTKHVSALKSKACSRSTAISSDSLEKNIDNLVEKEYMVSQRNDNLSDGTNVEFISPNDIIEMIGEQNFWSARKMICNQQRIFSMQVLELHRLIGVQRSLAGSADHLLEGNISLTKQMNKSSVKEKSSLKSIKKPPHAQPLLPQKKPEAPLPPPPPPPPPPPLPLQTKNNCSKKTTISVTSHESCQFVPTPVCDLNQAPHSASHHQCDSVSFSTSIDNSNKRNSCFDSPTGNQWLVPVMSPSGLVYKLYVGPYTPPAPGFMAPVPGACGNFAFPSNGTHLFNNAYGVAAASHLLNGAHSSHNSFLPRPPLQPPLAPYGLFLTNSSVNEAGVGPSVARSCYNKSWKSEGCAVSGQEDGLCEEGEVQQQQSHVGDIDAAESAKEVLPLFPIEPTSGQNLEPKEVVALDCESQLALKIFHGIEEERRCCESNTQLRSNLNKR